MTALPFLPKLKAYLSLFRFELPFSAGVCVVLGQIFALGEIPSSLIMLSGFGAVFFISASILIINDLFDIEIDIINAPERALPSRQVSKGEVLFLSLLVTFLGFLVSYLIGPTALYFSIILWIIGFLYNWKFKKTGFIGNLMVCISVGATFVFGGISVRMPFNELVWYFAAIAALIDLGEEIAADALDMKGDVKINSHSIAIKYGSKKAVQLSTTLFISVVIMSIFPFFFKWLSGVYLIPVLIMDCIIIYSTLKFRKTYQAGNKKYIRLVYIGALLGMLIILFLKVVLNETGV